MSGRGSDPRGLISLLICLAVVVLITVFTPDPAAEARRRWDDVKLGETGQMDKARVRATDVRLTHSIRDESDQDFTSAATLVMVDVTADVRRERMFFSQLSLRTSDDHDYSPRGEFLGEGLTMTQAGFTRRGTLVFEVPARRVPGSQLVIDTDGSAFDVLSSAIRIDLGLTDDSAVLPGPLLITKSVLTVTE